MYIHFSVLKYKNFLSSGNHYTEISLDTHKNTLIIGENGSGKSTILDALTFALYGRPFRKINKPQLINTINNKNLLVELQFNINNVEYLIKRGMKPTIFEIYQDNKLIDQESKNRDYQQFFEETILKMSYRTSQQTVVLGSVSFVPFMQLPALQRRQVIEEMLDLQVFTDMNNILKDKIVNCRQQYELAKQNIDFTEREIAIHKQNIEKMNVSVREQINEKQQQIQQVNEDVSKLLERQKYHDDRIAALVSKAPSKDDISKASTSIHEVTGFIGRLLEKQRNLNEEIKFFENNDQCPTCDQMIEQQFKQQRLVINTAEISKIIENNKLLEQKLAQLRNKVDVYNKLIQLIDRERISKTTTDNELNTKQWLIDTYQREIKQLEESQSQTSDSDLIDQLNIKQKLLDKQCNDLTTLKNTYDIVSILLKDGGIKAIIIIQYIDTLNKLLSKYLAAFDFFVQFEIDENFNETIKSQYRDEFSYESFSEGEKMRIDLALLFTWRAVSKMRNSVATNLLILDEVFDSSLDQSGLDDFMKIILSLTSDTNTYIIGHNIAAQERGDLIENFDRILKFKKIQNFSLLEEKE